MIEITVKHVEHIAFELARDKMTFNQPIPDFSTRFPNVLESCLAAPFQTFGGRSLKRGFIAKAAMLFYLMTKNHPFENGNKRIAMTTLFVFLHMNKKWLNVDAIELYRFAVWVASSPAKMNEEIAKVIEKFIKDHIVDI